jgi:hypothetical protein
MFVTTKFRPFSSNEKSRLLSLNNISKTWYNNHFINIHNGASQDAV